MRLTFTLLWALLVLALAAPSTAQAQENTDPQVSQPGTLQGRLLDATTKDPLVGANVQLIGTYLGAQGDLDGNFVIKNIKAGDYTVRISYIGYVTKEYTGIRIRKDETRTLNITLTGSDQTLETVEIVGERPVVDLESGRSEVRVSASDIKEMTSKNVQDIVALQPGVSQSPDGLQIRGGRVYETQYVVDGISAQDPLAGTGFGTNVASNSIQDVTVVTGGSGAEYNGNSGVIVTRIKEGGEQLQVFGRWQRDNFGANKFPIGGWNTDLMDLNVGGPIPGTNKKLRAFASVQGGANDTYFNVRAKQLNSSIVNNSQRWAPRQDNSWNTTLKFSYLLSNKTKISITNQNSLSISQNTRALQIIGFNAILVPGLQYDFTLQPDNATTYTHRSNLTALNFSHTFSKAWRMSLDAGRLFTHLRADANGRPLLGANNQILDPDNITTYPLNVFNPTDTNIVFVNPNDGFINNGGLATTWHDHWVQELTVKYKFIHNSKSGIHTTTFGHEHKQQSMQWVDITSPWIGAPITLPDGTVIPSRSLGATSDVWKVRPRQGGFFFQDDIRYKGIIATLGSRLEYWAPGDLAEQAVSNPRAPVQDPVREDFKKQTVPLLGRRWKARLLPRVNVSFPVTENNVLYFNYAHSMRVPHPRFVYAGLDPVFQDRSFLSNLGNPNLNPEVAVSYELGVKSQINRNLGVSFTAYYKDQFDYIVNRRVTVRDQTGRLVDKTFSINQDYARIRGIETMVNYRVSKRLRTMASVAYQVATGKSNTALESRLQVQNNGIVNTTKEQFLAFDRPWDLKGTLIYTPDSSDRLFSVPLNGFRFFALSTLKSGLRYTPQRKSGKDPLGRDIYESIETSPFTKIGSSWFWTDIRITRDFKIGRRFALSASVEITNVFDNKNAQIVNPVTGRAYRNGDPLPYGQRDPLFTGPQTSGTLPSDPARFMVPRQILYGVAFSF